MKRLLYIFLLILFFCFGVYFFMPKSPIEVEKIEYKYIFDTAYIQHLPETIFIYKPIPKYITEVRVDTVKENTILVTENKIYQDTIKCQEDSIIQEISITGINPTLDYSKVILKKQDKVITNTIEVTKFVKNNKRISLGLQLGYGYAFKPKQLTPYVGIGLNVKI